jgi:hypothetical protein
VIDEAAARRARESEMTESERNAARRAEALRRIEAAPPIEEDPRTRPKAGLSEEEALTKGRERFLLERERLVQKQPKRRARRRA